MWIEAMNSFSRLVSRREFLRENALGVGAVALACLLKQERLLATPKKMPKEKPTFDLKAKPPHFAPRDPANARLGADAPRVRTWRRSYDVRPRATADPSAGRAGNMKPRPTARAPGLKTAGV